MTRGRATLRVVASLALIALVAGCTGAPASTGPTPPPVASQACADYAAPYRSALEDLDARLNVGLTKADYNTRLGDVSVARNSLLADTERFFAEGPACQAAIGLLTEAFNAYVTANTAWGECFPSCDAAMPQIQAQWATASDKISQARLRFP